MKLYPKLLLGWIVLSLVLTWTPGEALPKPDFLDISFTSLLAHFGMFIVFAYLVTAILYQQQNSKLTVRVALAKVLMYSILFSLITETGQFFIPGRFFQLSDILINMLGALSGFGIFFLKFKYFSN